MSLKKLGAAFVLVLSMVVAAPKAASAATITIFNVCNVAQLCGHMSMTTSLAGGPGSSVNVVLNEVGPGDFGIFGNNGANLAFGFNIAGPTAGFSITSILPSPTFSVGPTNSNIGGGYGTFEYFVVGSNNGGGAAILPVSFTLNRTGGFAGDTLADIFEPNAGGYYAAAHLAGPLNSPAGGCDGGGCFTGFVAVDGPTTNLQTPEPASMILLGTGLLAAARARRKKAN